MSDAITADEIRAIRKSYGLSQKAFAALLGIGVASLARYELGAEPTKANANLIRAARNPEFMAACLEREGAKLADSQRRNAERIVHAAVSFEPDAPGLGADDAAKSAVSHAARNEALRSKAANLACDIMDVACHAGVDTRDTSEPLVVLLCDVLRLRTELSDTNHPAESPEGISAQLDYISGLAARLSENSPR